MTTTSAPEGGCMVSVQLLQRGSVALTLYSYFLPPGFPLPRENETVYVQLEARCVAYRVKEVAHVLPKASDEHPLAQLFVVERTAEIAKRT